MGDFRVQNFDVQLEDSGSGIPGLMFVTFAEPVDPDHARIVMGNYGGFASLAFSTDLSKADTWQSRDFGAGVVIGADGSGVAVLWDPTKAFESRVTFSVVEYVGAAGGANEFTVTRGVWTIATGDKFAEFAIEAIGTTPTTAQKVTLNKTGQWYSLSATEDTSGVNIQRNTVMIGITYDANFDTALHAFVQVGEVGPTVTVGWEAINWVGSNWGVGRGALGDAQRIVDAQDETSYDNSPTSEGVFAGGTGHAALDVISMADGSAVLVDAVSGGVVTQFTVTAGARGAKAGDVIAQESTTGSGINFTLTPDTDNIVNLGGWTTFTVTILSPVIGQTQPTNWDNAFVEGSMSIQTGFTFTSLGWSQMRLRGKDAVLDKIAIAHGGAPPRNTANGGTKTRDNGCCFYVISNSDLYVAHQGTFVATPDSFPTVPMNLNGPTKLTPVVDRASGSVDSAITAPSLCTVIGGVLALPVFEVNAELGTMDHSFAFDPVVGQVREKRTRDKIIIVLDGWWQVIQWGKDEVDTLPDRNLSVIDIPVWTTKIEAP